MDEALRCDRVALIRDGRILITEAPEVIRSRGRARIMLELAGGGRLEKEVLGYEEELPRLLQEYGLKPQVRRISVRRSSLEEVILSMIGEDGHAAAAGARSKEKAPGGKAKGTGEESRERE